MKTINIKHWTSDKDIKFLFSILKKEKEEVRFIGGCVRDLIIKKRDSDIDLATTIVPIQVLKILKKSKIKTLVSGISHGTVIAFINKKKFFFIGFCSSRDPRFKEIFGNFSIP